MTPRYYLGKGWVIAGLHMYLCIYIYDYMHLYTDIAEGLTNGYCRVWNCVAMGLLPGLDCVAMGPGLSSNYTRETL